MKNVLYTYRTVGIDITAGITNHELDINAERMQYITGTETLSVRLDYRSNDSFDLIAGRSIIAPFNRVFITAAAKAETISLFFGNPETVRIEIPA